jgi:hypothetical protein
MGFTWSGALSAQTKLDEEAAAREELEESRKTSLLGLYLKKLESQASSRTGDKYQTAANKAYAFEAEVSKAGLDEEDLAWYNNIFKDPQATADLKDFLDKRSAAGQPIDLADVRTTVNVINGPGSAEDKKDYLETVLNTDLGGNNWFENYSKLAGEITAISTTPGREVLLNIPSSALVDTGELGKDQDAVYNRFIKGDLINLAHAAAATAGSSGNTSLQANILADIKSAGRGGEEGSVAQYNLLNNYGIVNQDVIDSYSSRPAYKGLNKIPAIENALAASQVNQPKVIDILPASVPEGAIEKLLDNRNKPEALRVFNVKFGHLGKTAEEYIRQRTRER